MSLATERKPLTNKSAPQRPRFLTEYKPRIDNLLHQYTHQETKRIKSIWPYSADLIPPLMQFIERDGKRVRPSLAILGYKAFKGEVDDKVLLPALSTELMHDSFIIHDDLYDHIPGVEGIRRGEKVLHLKYKEEFEKRQVGKDSNWEPKSFAGHATVASSHVLLALGARTIHQSDFPPEIRVKALTYYWNTVEETWLGQGMDILSKGKPITEVSEGEVIMTERSRAGVYTAEFPLHLGAILAGADDRSLELITIYGRSVGLAFEIYDDVLGIFGKEGEIGKIQADLAEGKRTLLIQKALENGTEDQRQALLSILENRDPNEEQIHQAREIFAETGALDYTNNLVRGLVQEAGSALEKLDISEEDKESLKELALFVINRNK